jgi:4-amino-4-deoxy-L-arabinose transferase-like glycosyltransferase
MSSDKFRKKVLWLFLILFVFSSFFVLIGTFKLPLIDWDEATYADIARNTLATGNFMTLTRFGGPWFEKPPLYIWMVMGSIKAFGTSEFALRLPSVLLAVAAVLLLYLIMIELTEDARLSFLTALILLFTSPFYLFGTQSRMDAPVVAAMLFSVWCFLKGRADKRWLLGVGAGIGIGILFKSIIGTLAILPILSYGIVYRDWQWLRNKYLWLGFGLGFLIILPWHLYEAVLYGGQFWGTYLFAQVLHRGATDLQGMTNADYLSSLWLDDRPWSILALMLPCALLIKKNAEKASEERRVILFALLSSVMIFLFFAVARTKMWAYLLPLYPFLAIFVGMSLHYVFQNAFFSPQIRRALYCSVFAVALLFGMATTLRDEFVNMPRYYYPYVFDEKVIGERLAKRGDGYPVYLYNWSAPESLEFYGGGAITSVDTPPRTAAGSAYVITISNYLDTLYHDDPSYKTAERLYVGPTLTLLKI